MVRSGGRISSWRKIGDDMRRQSAKQLVQRVKRAVGTHIKTSTPSYMDDWRKRIAKARAIKSRRWANRIDDKSVRGINSIAKSTSARKLKWTAGKGSPATAMFNTSKTLKPRKAW